MRDIHSIIVGDDPRRVRGGWTSDWGRLALIALAVLAGLAGGMVAQSPAPEAVATWPALLAYVFEGLTLLAAFLLAVAILRAVDLLALRKAFLNETAESEELSRRIGARLDSSTRKK